MQYLTHEDWVKKNRSEFKLVAEEVVSPDREEFRVYEMMRLRSSPKQRLHLVLIVDNKGPT